MSPPAAPASLPENTPVPAATPIAASAPGVTPVPVPVPTPVASTVPARPQGAAPTGTDKPEFDDDGNPRPKDASPWTIAFAVTSVVLVLLLGLVWMKVLDR